jgi:tetratricopeptide (TPR) repeat protein
MGMLTDRQGNAVKGATADAVGFFDQGLEAFNLYRGDPLGLLEQAAEQSPEFAMAHIARAWILGLATEPAATAEARAIVERVRDLPLDERASGHLTALGPLLLGQWSEAARTLDRLNARHPQDLLALQAGHLIDFYRANARELRDRIARVLPRWSPDMPGHSILLGMYAFGLEECGDYARAEEYGRRALGEHPLDCWAHHAVTHVMEMQGRVEDGIGWMIAREPYWSGDDNFFKVHNWWHHALFHLQLDEHDEALALYDGHIRENRSAVALDLVDASALLWRLHLVGHDVGSRWLELADAWAPHADGRSYSFNDWHAVMAFLGAGRQGDVEHILGRYREEGPAHTEARRWAQQTGRALIEGFAAFWRGDYDAAVERLHGSRHIANAFGGSHAQRDVIDWTLAEAAVRAGLRDLAEALAHERLALKPHGPINRAFLSRSRAVHGEPAWPLMKAAG